MAILRTLDDALIDRVFQPVVNRLQLGNVMHAALPCYALAVAAQIGRALVLHAQGTLGEQVPGITFDIVTAFAIYGLAILFSHDPSTRPNPLRHYPMCRIGRLTGLLVTLWRFGVVSFIHPPDADTLLFWGNFALWTAGLCFASCDTPPPRLKRDARPGAVPDAI